MLMPTRNRKHDLLHNCMGCLDTLSTCHDYTATVKYQQNEKATGYLSLYSVDLKKGQMYFVI